MSRASRSTRPGSGRRPWTPPARERLQVTLEDIGYLGECVGRVDGLVVFAAYGLPGEEVLVEVDERKRRYVRGRVVEVLRPSPRRQAAPCPLFGACGGCSWQHVDYAAELAFKEDVVRRQLQRIGGFGEPPVREIIATDSPWRYRNQGRFSLTRDGHLGLTRRSSRSVLPVEDCLLMQEPILAVLSQLQGRLSRRHQVVVRCGARTGTLLVAPRLDEVPDVETGQDAYEEQLLGRRFRVSAHAFFQTNTRPAKRKLPSSLAATEAGSAPDDPSQAEILALLVIDRLALTGAEAVLDAYCGVGTFALLVANRARRVVGIEESRPAIADAIHNRRELERVQFCAGKVEEVLPQLDERFDAAILDPSRVGCAPETLAALLAIQPPKVAYVSCDPATLARDLRTLCESAYELVDVQPVDMFPRTRHVEVVATLAARARESRATTSAESGNLG